MLHFPFWLQIARSYVDRACGLIQFLCVFLLFVDFARSRIINRWFNFTLRIRSTSSASRCWQFDSFCLRKVHTAQAFGAHRFNFFTFFHSCEIFSTIFQLFSVHTRLQLQRFSFEGDDNRINPQIYRPFCEPRRQNQKNSEISAALRENFKREKPPNAIEPNVTVRDLKYNWKIFLLRSASGLNENIFLSFFRRETYTGIA